MPLVRLILFLALGFRCVAAPAAVTCEQLADIAFSTQQLRDQGHSLQMVLAEADKLESSKKFTADELDRIKDVVVTAFKSIRSPLEVLQECKDKLPR
jgi:esterase/lipase